MIQSASYLFYLLSPMYNPIDAHKSYVILLKEKGLRAALQSALLVTLFYTLNKLNGQDTMSLPNIAAIYFFFCAYFTWKPKLIRFLRGKLRGEDYRHKGDD